MFERAFLLAVLIAMPGLAQAYIGPGLGAGALAAVTGVLGAIFLAIVGVVYYPVKRILKKRRKAAEKAETDV